MRKFTYYILFLSLLVLFSTHSYAIDIKLDYTSTFSSLFDADAAWENATESTVITNITNLVTTAFSAYDLDLVSSDEDITVYFDGDIDDPESYFGVAHPYIGAYFYDSTPHAHINVAYFASVSEWQGVNATNPRIAQGLANVVCHEIGHVLNLWHAYEFSCFDPTDTGTLKYPRYYPRESQFIDSGTLSTYRTTVTNPENYIMDNYYGDAEDRATIERDYSDYSDKVLDFYIPAGGTPAASMLLGVLDESLDPVITYHALPLLGDVTISQDVTLILPYNSTLEMTVNKEIDVSGTLDIWAGATITRNGATGTWDGITINSGGTLSLSGGDATIEYAATGVKLNGGGTITNSSNTLHFRDCSGFGLHVYNTSPTLQNMFFSECDGTGYTGGIKVSGGANPTLSSITIVDGDYGVWVYNADATMYESVLLGNSDHCFRYDVSGSSLTLENSGSGDNNINPASGKYAVYRTGSTAVTEADDNWWGDESQYLFASNLFYPSTCVSSSAINTAQDDSTFTAGAYKRAPFIPSLFDLATSFESENLLEEAYNAYSDALIETDDEVIKRRSIKKMIHIAGQLDLGFDDVRSVIEAEITNSGAVYGAILDYLLADIKFLEGDYSGAVSDLSQKAATYKDSWMESEMLTFAAVVSGDYLGNRMQARTFADRATAVNPGYGVLDVAYDAAGMKYIPSEHVDIFADGSGNVRKPAEPVTDPLEEETGKPSLTVSPNPANPATTLHYTLTQPGNVKINIYSVSGQKVATLVNEFMSSGKHAVVFDGSNLASGVYFYHFQTDGFAKSGKMLVVK